MITIRPADRRGVSRYDWLDSRHTFSFDHYYEPKWMGYRSLRVINDDRVAPGAGFPTHGHRDMEILTWVLQGALAHKDSTGGGSTLAAGEIQRMSAGTGIRHSEFNHSQTEPVHFLQIWLLPERKGIEPGYEQRAVPSEERVGRLRLIAAPEGRGGAVSIRQDADVYATLLGPGESVTHVLRPERHVWIQMASGKVVVNGLPLEAGDGAAVSEETQVQLVGTEPSEALLFDLS